MANKAIIFDTDIASAFAKIGKITLLKKLFSKHDIYITPEIYEELAAVLDYGYKFPLEIFKEFNVLATSERERREYQEWLLTKKSLGKGELEAITTCKEKKLIFSSMDTVALAFAQENDIETLELHSILKALWKSNLLSKEDTKKLIKEIEEKDNTIIKDVEKILNE